MARPPATAPPNPLFAQVPSRSDVRNTSILEVMIIIVFVALILLSDAYGENDRLNEEARKIQDLLEDAELSALGREELEAGYAGAKTRVENLEAIVEDLQAQNQATEERRAELAGDLETLQSALAETEKIRDTLAGSGLLSSETEDPVEALERIGGALAALREQVGEQTQDSVSLLQEVSEALDQITVSETGAEDLRQSLGLDPSAPIPVILQVAEERLHGLQSDLSSMQDQVAQLAEAEADRLRKLRGWVPCWPTEENGYDFTYSVTMYDTRFEVAPGWPGNRSDAVEAASVLTPPNGSLSREAFRAFADPIFKLGVNHPSDCRYVVRAFDKTTNKDSYKTQLGILRRYFIYVER